MASFSAYFIMLLSYKPLVTTYARHCFYHSLIHFCLISNFVVTIIVVILIVVIIVVKVVVNIFAKIVSYFVGFQFPAAFRDKHNATMEG